MYSTCMHSTPLLHRYMHTLTPHVYMHPYPTCVHTPLLYRVYPLMQIHNIGTSLPNRNKGARAQAKKVGQEETQESRPLVRNIAIG